MTKEDQDKMGIFQNHAYSLLNIYSGIKVGTHDITLLKVRNPWGKKQWQGRWSFKSNLWTKQLRAKLGYEVHPMDGSFFINQEDFKIYFQYVHICRVNLAFKNSWIDLENQRDQFKTVKMIVR